jgi:hypothetical protein
MQQALISLVSETDKASGTPMIGDRFINFMAEKAGKFQNTGANPDAKPEEKLSAIINTMKNVGHAGAGTPDGIWGPRTNVGLNNVVAFAESLLELAKQNNNQVSYDEQKLNAFRSLIPSSENAYSEQMKDGYADAITKGIQDIHTLYNQVAQQNLNKEPAAQQKPATSQQPQSSFQLNEGQINSIKMQYPRISISISQPDKTEDILEVSVDDLLNVNAFEQWRSKNAASIGPMPPQDILQLLLEEVALPPNA